MKAQMKAIVASAVVIALCLATVGGVTYSWFSDSEEAEIDVDTAIVDMVVQFGNPTVPANSITTIEEASTPGTFEIKKLVAGFTGTIPVNSIINNSNINTLFRDSIIITIPTTASGNATLTNYDAKNILVNGKSLYEMGVKNTDDTSDTAEISVGYYTFNSAWQTLSIGTNPSVDDYTISTPTTYGDDMPSDWAKKAKLFSITIKMQLYQGNYIESVSETLTSTERTATAAFVDSNGSMTVSAAIADDVTDGSKLTISKIGDNSGFKVGDNTSLSFDYTNTSGTPIEDFSSPTTITVVINGLYSIDGTTYPALAVTYLGNDGKDQPIVTSVTPNTETNTTTVVFTTTHFSDFILSKVNTVNTAENLNNAVATGGFVKLGNNITADVVVPAGSSVILDLNGKTLTNSTSHTIQNYGNLTIIDSSTGSKVVSNTNGKANVLTEIGGKTIILDGEYTKNTSYYVVKNRGTCFIAGGSFNASGEANSMIVNGFDSDAHETEPATKATMVINGGDYSYSGQNVLIKNDEWAILTVNNGTFNIVPCVLVQNWDITTINGGTFNTTNPSRGLFGNGTYNGSSGQLTVTGGIFTYNVLVDNLLFYEEYTNITLIDGTFNRTALNSADLNSFVNNPSFEVKNNGGIVTITKKAASA